MLEKSKPLVLIIMDGWGVSPENQGNAIITARTPNFDRLVANYPYTNLEASGQSVGLSWGEPGNSEVGHLNLGAGRVVWQDLPRINRAIKDKSFFSNSALLAACQNARKNRSKLHLIGLVSDGGVHSYIEHLFALLILAKKEKIKDVFIHAICDGRDTPPRKAAFYFTKLAHKIKEIGTGTVVDIIGRYFAMDRDNNWQRTQVAYNLLVFGQGKIFPTVNDALNSVYFLGQTDEFIEPCLISASKKPLGRIADGDSVIFFNFRPDRARQLNAAFTQVGFDKFKVINFKNLFFVTFTLYEQGNFIEQIAFPPINLDQVLAQVISERNLSQLHIAETEKYAHVTYFFAGGREITFPKEARILIPSLKVATYDLAPEMSAPKITLEAAKQILSGKFKFVLINFANCDMVGHTGKFDKAKKAVEAVDHCLGQVFETVQRIGGALLITADHGNVEQMLNLKTNTVDKEHTTNPVPFLLILPTNQLNRTRSLTEQTLLRTLKPSGILADVAPTILEIMGIPKPEQMTGISLIKNLS